MKLSKYNFHYKLNENTEETLIYNSRTNALALIENDNFKYLSGESDNIVVEDKELRKNLLHGGFLLDSNVNELDLIKIKMLKARFNNDSLGLTIAPTLACNFKCIYCYEKENLNSSYMTEEVIQAMLEFIKKRIEIISNLGITWYGGEPLLALDTIEYLSKEIIKMCEENNVHYNAGIITNGYSFTKEVAQKLKDLKVEHAQITLDGTEEIHNKRRPLVNGRETFDTIIQNINDTADIMKISVRVNTDKSNIDKLDALLDTLISYNLHKRVHVYLGFVDSINECYADDKCLSREGFSKLNYSAEKKLVEKGFVQSSEYKYPRLYANYCGADNDGAFVVGPKGYIYKCYNEIGDRDAVVDSILDTDEEFNLALYNKYMLHMPVDDEVCSECKLLPICMGGCPYHKISKNDKKCSEYKYSLEEYLKDTAKYIIKKRESEINEAAATKS
ncbi:radical SAM protein [Clostridium sp. 'deep sea']|uniref:radical SAM/SPASM domain-containing protein n=1 Tax=Clostridium sp. 'deep sea' TaxID=2779445 RepID=UPI0018969445|nr:radical SAM protein [Clostridium sp. 'deep sea']QOR35742.1 radical SAM protein [Clostridium sp. 'deep sea']